MTPPVPAVLAELAALAIRGAAPGIPDGERANALGLTASLLAIAAETWDAAAHHLVEENQAIRALTGEVGRDENLRLTALQAENNRLREALITLQTRAESDGDEALQTRIWAELIISTDRRRLSTAPV